MSSNRNVLVLVGPTASGKTDLSIVLAERLGGEIVSADSRQIYKRLDIGTAKPSREQRQKIPHHFIDVLALDQDYSAGQYAKEARDTIEHIFRRGSTPIVVGGSGLYVKALLDGLFDGPAKDPETRAILQARLEQEGAESLYRQLQEVDPLAARTMDPTKPRRIMRALEVYFLTGKPISQFHREQERSAPFDFVEIGLLWDRKHLYRRIEERVDRMMAMGFLEEVEGLRRDGYDTHINALNTVGYKELFAYLNGRLSLDEAVRLIKQNTRRFAKRQMTWFRADRRIHWISLDERTEHDALVAAVMKVWNP